MKGRVEKGDAGNVGVGYVDFRGKTGTDGGRGKRRG